MMKMAGSPNDMLSTFAATTVGRRGFLRNAGLLGLGAAAGTMLAPQLNAQTTAPTQQQQATEQGLDTITEILTAALIAEDLATTFYYHGLTGSMIGDPRLAGTDGTATKIASDGNVGNVLYLRAALSQEIAHANILRGLLDIPHPSADPYQTFYFPNGTFDNLDPFLKVLDALENAFIGAYLNALQEIATRASQLSSNAGSVKTTFTATQLQYMTKVVGSILGVECEHRVLGRVISNSNPANDFLFEQTDGLDAVYNGPNSAVAALTPFLGYKTGDTTYSFPYALANEGSVSIALAGPPATF